MMQSFNQRADHVHELRKEKHMDKRRKTLIAERK
jgi:hypothetical protein